MDEVNEKTQVVKLYFEIGRTIKGCVRKTFEEAGITMPQSLVIGALIENKEMKISELGEFLNLSNSTISGIIDRLEKQDFVVRTRSEEDRRTVKVKLTDKMLDIHAERHKLFEQYIANLLSSATDDDMLKIVEGLQTFKEVINNRKEC